MQENVSLKSLNTLQVDVTAKFYVEIKNFQWTDIHLDWLKNLNQEDAKLLAWVECKYLWLNGLEHIDKNTAEELWKSKCEYLLLWWLPSLNKDVSKALTLAFGNP